MLNKTTSPSLLFGSSCIAGRSWCNVIGKILEVTRGAQVLPLLLICLDTVLSTLAVAGVIDGKTALVEFLRMLGKTPVALLITLLVSLAVIAAWKNLRSYVATHWRRSVALF